MREFSGEANGRGALTGRVIDRWVLGDEIGRGGMSVVYHAHRDGDGFGQDAAMKILSMTFAGRAMLDSFLRERRILSGLHHPGIARLIDGGVTNDGAPWLVMEYVDGVRIDQWCRDNHANTRSVVQLVEQLARAVAYAQRHLVIHRDINSANVLVNERNRPVLIDFGIAGLMGREDTRTMHAFTPQFAAPEQVAGEDCTTATDVYAIGRLLQTLLVDHTVDRDLRLLIDVATHQDPDQRYANARNLAEDLQAWLDNRPMRARAPSLRYRAGKFIARNRWGVAAAALLFVAILGGLATSLWQARIAAHERDVARAESARARQVTHFLQNLFRASDPDEAQGETVTARELLDVGGHQLSGAFEGDPALRGQMLVLLGNLYRELGELDTAEPLLREGLALADTHGDDNDRVDALRALSRAQMDAGNHDDAIASVERAIGILEELDQVPGPRHATLMEPLLFSLTELGRSEEAVTRGQAALDLARQVPSLPDPSLYEYLYALSTAMGVLELNDRALPLMREAADLGVVDEDSPSSLISLLGTLASGLERQGNLTEGLELRQQALATAERIYPRDHLIRARTLNNLGNTFNRLGRYEEAAAALSRALAIYEKTYGDEAIPRVAAVHNNLGNALRSAGDLETAATHIGRAQQMAGEIFGLDDYRFTIATCNLGNVHRLLGRFESAGSLFRQCLETRLEVMGADHPSVGNAQVLMADLRLDEGKYAEALALCNAAMALYDTIGYDRPRERLATLTRHARALDGLQRHAEARTAFNDAAALAEAAGEDAGSSREEFEAAYAAFQSRTTP
ncbi:serine/threonine protein kinase [Marinihelvus fidelis]|uniref:Serine/threonine protein kinase n=1 Tax=Marinihelvus fidelis TaxID=2613842 RepID=A0A5N0TBV7_9GAMM|nr:serine/threonine protein kinase [Marinihelvus fidelis]